MAANSVILCSHDEDAVATLRCGLLTYQIFNSVFLCAHWEVAAVFQKTPRGILFLQLSQIFFAWEKIKSAATYFYFYGFNYILNK